ncbi:MAG TPA: hypothetical protein DCZ48_10360 [Methylococcaceae bacterium]|nr:hypothetical protein [Methylococcaceae bacterium]
MDKKFFVIQRSLKLGLKTKPPIITELSIRSSFDKVVRVCRAFILAEELLISTPFILKSRATLLKMQDVSVVDRSESMKI